MSRVAKRYSKALFQLGDEENKLNQLEKDLVQIEDLLEESEEFKTFIANPLISEIEKAKIITRMFKGKLSDTGYNFLQLLTEKKRQEIFPALKREAISWGIGTASPEEIDEVNILQATFLAMQRSLIKLKIKPDYILVDGNQMPENLFPGENIIGGDDKSFTIAAASIIAKAEGFDAHARVVDERLKAIDNDPSL